MKENSPDCAKSFSLVLIIAINRYFIPYYNIVDRLFEIGKRKEIDVR